MKLLFLGGCDTLAQAFARGCETHGIAHARADVSSLDAPQRGALDALLEAHGPTVCVHAAEPPRSQEDESPTEAWRARCVRPVRLAEACARQAIALVTLSSDGVFDGWAAAPYLESSPTSPASASGRAEAAAEVAVIQAHRNALVIRTAALFDPFCATDFVSQTLARTHQGLDVAAACDHVVSPTYTPDLVDAALALVTRAVSGIWHVTNAGAMSWFELARAVCVAARVDPRRVRPERPALRPGAMRLTALRSGRGCRLPRIEDAIERCLQVRRGKA